MLDAFIIEEIKRRERARQEKDRPTIRLPLPEDEPSRRSETDKEEAPQRGVVVVDV